MPELTNTEWAAYLTAGAESTHHSVDYLTPEVFESKTFDKTVQAFALSGGLSQMATFQPEGEAPARRPLFFVGTAFRTGPGINVADAQQICRPVGTGAATECLEAPVGEPSTVTTTSWTAEARFWSWGTLQSIGFNPRYSFVRQEKDAQEPRTVRTIEAPIYFMRQVKDMTVPEATFGADLIGGVTVGWRESKSGAAKQSGVFVTLF